MFLRLTSKICSISERTLFYTSSSAGTSHSYIFFGPGDGVLGPGEVLRGPNDFVDDPQYLGADVFEQILHKYDLAVLVLEFNLQKNVLDRAAGLAIAAYHLFRAGKSFLLESPEKVPV